MSGLLEHDRFLVSQKVKLIELTNEYRIHDENGADLGFVRQEGQSKLRKALRFVSSVDQFLTTRLSIYDDTNTKVLELTRPAKIVKSKIFVQDPAGNEIGKIIQRNAIGKIRFGLEDPSGRELGEIRGKNWIAWDFSIVDANGEEVAVITKTWEGLITTVFTTADNYLIEIRKPVEDDLRKLLLAAAFSVDTALKQDDRGLG